MSLLLRRKAAVFITAIVGLSVSSGAIAHWTTGGAGGGTAASAISTSVTITQTSTPSGIHPGGPAADLAGAFDNANDASVVVDSVSATVSSVTRAPAAIDAALPCLVTDYQLNDFPVTVGAPVPSGSGVGSWTGASIQLLESGLNQDGCMGATVNLAYASN